MARSGRVLAALPIIVVVAVLLAACLPPNSRGRSNGQQPGDPAASTGVASAVPSGPRPSPSFVRPTPTPGPTFVAYVVKSGDTITSIAKQFHTTGRSIAYWNAATYPTLDPESAQYQPGLLKVGWTLQVIPNVTFDEQTLPEPSDLIDDTPSEPGDGASGEPGASDGG